MEVQTSSKRCLKADSKASGKLWNERKVSRKTECNSRDARNEIFTEAGRKIRRDSVDRLGVGRALEVEMASGDFQEPTGIKG